jgi:hypothetical protein
VFSVSQIALQGNRPAHASVPQRPLMRQHQNGAEIIDIGQGGAGDDKIIKRFEKRVAVMLR